MSEMANSSLSQLLTAGPARNGAVRERGRTDAQTDLFSRTLDQKMSAPERPAERPVERSADRSTARQTQSAQAAQAPQRPAAPAAASQARQAASASKPADRPAENGADAPAGDAAATTAQAATADETAPADTAAQTTSAAPEPATASTTPAAADPAAVLAATPAALAAATANPAAATAPAVSATEAAVQAAQTRQARGSASDLLGQKGQGGATQAGQETTGLTAPAPEDTGAAISTAKARPTNFAELLAANTAARGTPAPALGADASAAGNTTAPGLNTAMTGVQVPAADRPQATQAALPMHIHTSADDATWGDAVGNRVMWLAGRNESKAELILTPPHLGKLEISLTVTGDTTTAQFTAATPAAREALENAMPRLREMLEQAGVTLADSNVNTAARDGRDDTGQHGHRHAGGTRGADVPQENLMSRSGPWLMRGEGMIDTFA